MEAESGTCNTTCEPGDEADERPIPPRYWWLKRFVLLGVVLVLALLGMRWWWGWEAERRLEAKIAEYKAAGQPVELADFAAVQVPDRDNAALVLQQAIAKYKKPPDTKLDLDDFSEAWRVADSEPAKLAKLIDTNEEVLRLLHEARSKPAADWGMQLKSPAFSLTLPDLSSQRRLAKLASLAARYQHASDDGGALETVRDTLALGRRVESVVPTVITHLVRVAIDALATQVIESISPSLRVGQSTDTSQPAKGAASAEAVRALIAELLDDTDTRQAGLQAIYGERASQLDSVRCIVNGRSLMGGSLGLGGGAGSASLDDRAMSWALAPAWLLDAQRMMEDTTELSKAAVAPDWPAAKRLLPVPWAPEGKLEKTTRMLSSLLASSLDRHILFHFRSLSDRHMAATALAMRLFELDHGRRPAALGEMVPDYLPAVPLDLFADDGREIGYLPDSPQPLLYSVGTDGVDDGGKFGLRTDGAVDRDTLDDPFFLNGRRPQAKLQGRARPTTASAPASQPTSTQAAEDD